jgi:ribonuclease HI
LSVIDRRDTHTTNNRMELKAAIEGLAALEETCEVEVVVSWLSVKWRSNVLR